MAGLDLRAMTGRYRGSGEASCHPSVLLGLLIHGYATGVMGFRQFSLRGLDKVRGEWSLVTMSWNIKRLFVLAAAM